jgi:hypothetical protein
MSRYAWYSGAHTRLQQFTTVVIVSLFLLLSLPLLTITYQPLVTARTIGTVTSLVYEESTLPLSSSNSSDNGDNSIGTNDGSQLPELVTTKPFYALVTQLITTSLIGIGCFLLFCITRTRWPTVYAPKELAQ